MKVKNVMFTGFAAAVLAFACNSADAAVRLATEELVETKQAKLTADNVTKDGTGKIVTGVTAADGVVTVAHGDLAVTDVTGLQDALNEKQVKLSVEDGSAIKITEAGLISLEGLATNDELGDIQDALKVDGQIVTQASQDEKISALETKVGDTSVTQTITNALTTGKYIKEDDNVSLLTNDAGYITNADLTGYAKTDDLGDLATQDTVEQAQVVGLVDALAGKQATITDLEAIRTGAGLGATAVQEADLDDYVTDTELTGKGYITESAIGKANFVVKKNTADTGTTFNANATENVELNLGLADVATSGSYDDLSDTPEIPSIDGLASETYVDNSVATRVAGALPVQNGTYLVSSNGINVTWTAVEVIGADGNALTLTSTATGADSGVQQ